MILHALGLLYAFVFSAVVSAGITLSPIAVTWSSIWVYISFILCLIPGYIAAWLTLVVGMFLLALMGFGVMAGGAAAVFGGAAAIDKLKNR